MAKQVKTTEKVETRGVKAGVKRGKYKKRNPKPRISKVIKEKTIEELASNFIELQNLGMRKKNKAPLSCEIPTEAPKEDVPYKHPNANATSFQKGVVHTNNRNGGRPKGSRNRSTIVREILQAVKWGRDPLTGKEDFIPMEYQMTLAILNKAMKGDVNAYNALMNNSYKPHAQEIESKNANIDLTQFSHEELKGFLKDGDE
jgi:hypothetical protein